MPRKKTSKTKSEMKKSLRADVYNTRGQVVSKIKLPEQVFGRKVDPFLLAQAVRVYLGNQRSGTRAAKTRSQVTGSTRKIYRQKGTGRARHGDIKAPIFVGGGVAHGPKKTNYHFSFPKKMKNLALRGALTYKFQSGNLKFVNNLSDLPQKTKNMADFLKSLKLTSKDKLYASTLIVTDKVLHNVYLSGRNIPNLTVTPVNQLNTYQVLKNQYLVVAKDAVDLISSKKDKQKETKKSTSGKK